VAVLDRDGEYVEGFAGLIGHATNNVAEYQGLLEALRLARTRGARDVELRSDSELVVRQLQGRYKVRNAGLVPLYREARRLIARLDRFRIVHVPRGMNVEADRLLNLALDRADEPGAPSTIHETAGNAVHGDP
jgi:ribonuclease HI